MGLQFEQLQTQIQQMGTVLANRNHMAAEQAEAASALLAQLNDLNAIWRQIMIARQNDAGFRGAAPMDEPINQPIPLPEMPAHATIFAADGSQIYPDIHAPAPYWLTNIGVFIYHHGTDDLPEMVVTPQLYFEDRDVLNQDGQLIPNSVINARRSVYEMQMLANVVHERNDPHPILALYDGPLLGMPMGREVPDALSLQADYHEALDFLLDNEAVLAGYIDRPSSRFVLYTVYLMTLIEEEITRNTLSGVRLEGMTDVDLYKGILPPGARSGLMTQQSPLNKEYKEKWADSHEICFFYLNVASPGQAPYLARVEIPMWVARSKAQVATAHALIYHQCQITDRYPYALTRADEIAVVQPAEKRALEEMIAVEMLRNQQPVSASQKLSSKWLARYGRQQYEGV